LDYKFILFILSELDHNYPFYSILFVQHYLFIQYNLIVCSNLLWVSLDLVIYDYFAQPYLKEPTLFFVYILDPSLSITMMHFHRKNSLNLIYSLLLLCISLQTWVSKNLPQVDLTLVLLIDQPSVFPHLEWRECSNKTLYYMT